MPQLERWFRIRWQYKPRRSMKHRRLYNAIVVASGIKARHPNLHWMEA